MSVSQYACSYLSLFVYMSMWISVCRACVCLSICVYLFLSMLRSGYVRGTGISVRLISFSVCMSVCAFVDSVRVRV